MATPETAFPAPGHDHARCTADAINHAERICDGRNRKLTPMRRDVLHTLLESHRPLGAYDIIETLGQRGARPAPITIYRALDFLIENGIVHRIESRNAFLACGQHHEAGSTVAFLICDHCGSVGEASPAHVSKGLAETADDVGFLPKMSVVEISGTCAHCQRST